MNRRQKKKWNKNHIILMDTRTGKQSTIKFNDFIRLCKIAALTPNDIEYMCRDINNASG